MEDGAVTCIIGRNTAKQNHDADFLGFYEILYNIYTRSVTPDRAVEIASANLGITKEEATKSIESIMENSKDFYIPNFGGVYIE